jgi:hypothetical protein
MKASSSSRVSTRWVFGLLGAVLFCNVLLLHFMQQGPTQDTQQEVDEARQRAQEAGRLAQSLYHDNEALQQRVRLLNRERDSLLAGQPAGTSSAGSSSSGSGSSTDTRTVARLIEEVKDRSGEMARQLQREASIALINHIHRNQNPPSCLPSSSYGLPPPPLCRFPPMLIMDSLGSRGACWRLSWPLTPAQDTVHGLSDDGHVRVRLRVSSRHILLHSRSPRQPNCRL